MQAYKVVSAEVKEDTEEDQEVLSQLPCFLLSLYSNLSRSITFASLYSYAPSTAGPSWKVIAERQRALLVSVRIDWEERLEDSFAESYCESADRGMVSDQVDVE
jgi:hypothetical protein